MAEALLSVVVEGIVGTLTSSVLQEIGLWWGVKGEIELLRTTVIGVKKMLFDAEDRQARGEGAVKDWLDKLKEVLYDADDLLDDVSTAVLRRQVMTGNKATKEVRLFFSSSNQLAYGLKMGHKIKAMRERINAVMVAGVAFNFQQRPDSTPTSVMAKKREDTHSSVPEIVVGREADKNEIKQRLLSTDYETETNVSVISIVGIGGLGKTTLAKLAYNDEDVKSRFELRMWVCVSDDFSLQLIVEKILESTPNTGPMDKLVTSLKEKIDGKKYLLVLDDVWNENRERWNSLRDLLIGGAKGSRILVTTRSKKVAEITSCVSQERYELMGLSNEESWSLFAQIAFEPSRAPPTPDHKAIGKEIVAKCRGLPLAIRVIGGLMCSKETKLEWESFKSKELTMMDEEEGSNIQTTLKLSYDRLPSHLKPCFAYCRLFPKDHQIDVDTLVALWMAQGYIKSSDPSQCLEDIGREYFIDLLRRSFFQEKEEDEWGNIISSKMHDLMHDLASSVAGTESVCASISNPREVGEKTRHISFDFDSYGHIVNWQVPISVLEAKNLRTFLTLRPVFGGAECKIVKGQCQAIFRSLKRLRQLDLQKLNIETVPSSIGKLKHLRYLNLSDNEKIQMLPRSITRLQNLQVLKLLRCGGLRQLPNDIKKLVSLRQLDIKSCDALTHMPRGIGGLTSLEKLTRFVLPKSKSSKGKQQENQSGGLDELHDLNNLGGELSIENLPHHGANLKEKPRLQELRLEWVPLDGNDIINDNEDEMSLEALRPHPNLKALTVENYGGMKFASWLSSLTNLVRLVLKDCPKCRSLPALDQFPSLKHIKIRGLTDLEYIDIEICSSSNSSSSSNNNSMVSFFPSLETLKLKHCPNLKGWRPSSPSSSSSSSYLLPQFQCLSELRIKSCPNLTSMPPLPPSLKVLDIESAGLKSLELMLMGTISPAAHAEGGSAICSSSNNNSIANFKEKPRLQGLTFKWVPFDSDDDIIDNEDEMSLEALQPHPNLKALTVENYGGMKFASRLSSLTNLVSLVLTDCPKCRSLPALDQIPSLEDIAICGLTDLEYIDIQICSSSNSSSSSNNNSMVSFFPSLERMELYDCPNLKGWRPSSPSSSSSSSSLLPQFHCLSQLIIASCPNLTSMPPFPSLKALYMWSGNFKTLEQMLKGTISPAAAHDDAPSSSSSLPSTTNNNNLSSSSLNILRIHNIEDMPEDFLPVELLQTLTSLDGLTIWNCPTLTCLPHAKMLLLTSLERLWIQDCEDLDLSNYDDDDDDDDSNNNNDAILWQGPGLRSLTHLHIQSIPKLVHLPRRLLLRSTVLKNLKIDKCPNLESLPEWMPNLTSLQCLDMSQCSLQLSERCKNNMGEDWPKIAHIPTIRVNWYTIQCDGCYIRR